MRNAVVAVTLLVCVALVVAVLVKSRAETAFAARSAAEYTPPPLATPSPAPLPVVAVIGEDTTSSAGSGVSAAQRWTSLLASTEQVQVQVYASDGAGYTVRGRDGRTFQQEAARVPSDAEIVIVFGGSVDVTAPELSLSRAVGQTISTVQRRAPHAKVVVVGPVTDQGAEPGAVTTLRTGIKNATGAFSLAFIDPIQQAWLNGSPHTASNLSAADERALASHFSTVVDQNLPASD